MDSAAQKSAVAQPWRYSNSHWNRGRKRTARNSKSFTHKHLNYLCLPVVPCMQLQLQECSNFIHKINLILVISNIYNKAISPSFQAQHNQSFLSGPHSHRIISLSLGRISQVSPFGTKLMLRRWILVAEFQAFFVPWQSIMSVYNQNNISNP